MRQSMRQIPNREQKLQKKNKQSAKSCFFAFSVSITCASSKQLPLNRHVRVGCMRVLSWRKKFTTNKLFDVYTWAVMRNVFGMRAFVTNQTKVCKKAHTHQHTQTHREYSKACTQPKIRLDGEMVHPRTDIHKKSAFSVHLFAVGIRQLSPQYRFTVSDTNRSVGKYSKLIFFAAICVNCVCMCVALRSLWRIYVNQTVSWIY